MLTCGAVAAAADAPVSYYRDVRPIFNSNCNACHKPEKMKGELDMTSVAAMLKGGKHGHTVEPGSPDKSKVIEMISGTDPDMPKDGDPLAKEQVSIISRWIAQGAKDDTPLPGTAHVDTPVYMVPPVITALAYSPDGSVLAVTGYHEILLHTSDGSKILARLLGESPRLESLAFSTDGKMLAACGGSAAQFGQVQVWDVAARKAAKTFNVGTDELYGVSFSPDGKSVAFGGADKVVHRIDLATGKELLDFKAHADWVLATEFTHDGKQLVSAGRDRAMKLIDLETSRFVDDINNPLEACLCLAIHPKEEQILYGGDLGFARLYKISDNQKRTAGRNDTNLIRTFDRQRGPVTAVAFSADGSHVALGSLGVVNIYPVAATDKSVLSLSSGIAGPVYTISYRPDGAQIAVAGYDGQVRLFDPKTGTLIKQFVPVPLSAAGTLQEKPANAEGLFHDSFRGKLADGWSWIREAPGHWRVTDHGLEVQIQPGNMWGPANDAKNVLVRPIPDHGDRPIEVAAAVSHHPTHQYEQVDLAWYYSDSNMVKIGEELVDGKLSVVMGREENDKTRTIKIIPLDSNDVQLRLTVTGNRIKGQFKKPGADWAVAGECDLPEKGEPKITLQFYQGPADQEHWGRVSDFTIRIPE
jgi:WD40 repeat protein/regulation of enolase protein 1 (concanavalin A-like superfamily)